ncbi:hypothetical protein BKP45_15960 [Anaerobacillus alkalidiazotrophicus]|uniref:Uncharacterized protein n=1 Tax=Anaerobacillus alkalidiazotrophicus TaxID=472963 RepID=A0A1S2M435_9BACI|nr:hypothetical protein [Anaerobacillus alkalidiazotrophicus]OIJ18687.1 hypothetical protein BKP45_15960 [Anaerobacillus alkalidiazotrophicus]
MDMRIVETLGQLVWKIMVVMMTVIVTVVTVMLVTVIMVMMVMVPVNMVRVLKDAIKNKNRWFYNSPVVNIRTGKLKNIV